MSLLAEREPSESPDRLPRRLLVVELGDSRVWVAICEAVGGRYRLIGSTGGHRGRPPADVGPSLLRVLHDLERTIGCRLLEGSALVVPEAADGRGVDAVVLTSVGRLQLTAVVLTRVSAAAIEEAIDPAIAKPPIILLLEDLRAARQGLVEELLNALGDGRADAIIVAGGTDRGNGDDLTLIARALEIVAASLPRGLPPVLLATSSTARDRFSAVLGQHQPRSVDALNPRLRQTSGEALREELRTLWFERFLLEPISKVFAGRLSYTPIPTLEGLTRAVQALALWREAPVWLVDWSDSEVTVIRVLADGVDTVSYPLEQLGSSATARELSDWRTRPELVGNDPSVIARQRFLMAEAIAFVAADLPTDGGAEVRPDLVIGRGVGLVARLPATDAASALCEGLGITGATVVGLDRHALLSAAGRLLEPLPDVAADLFFDAMEILGTVATGWTDATTGSTAPSAEVVDRHGAESLGLVTPDLHLRLPPAAGDLTIKPSRAVDFGAGLGHEVSVSRGEGELGILVRIATGGTPRHWAAGKSRRAGSRPTRGLGR